LAALVAPAASATVNPKALVLAENEAPRYYTFDANNSLAFSRPRAGGTDSQSKRLLEAGIERGYIVRYLDNRAYRYVYSTAFVFTRPAGAKRYFAQIRNSAGSHPTSRSRVDLGAEGFMYSLDAPDTGTAVAWRHGRVVASVTCAEMTRHRWLALRLARKQEQRIRATLD
jgi:hypothetical protein